MTTAQRTTNGSRPIRRSPWIVIVDVVLPAALVFWMAVDRSTAAVASLVRMELSERSSATRPD